MWTVNGVFLLTERKSGSRTVDRLITYCSNRDARPADILFFHTRVTMVTSPTPCSKNKRVRHRKENLTHN